MFQHSMAESHEGEGPQSCDMQLHNRNAHLACRHQSWQLRLAWLSPSWRPLASKPAYTLSPVDISDDQLPRVRCFLGVTGCFQTPLTIRLCTY